MIIQVFVFYMCADDIHSKILMSHVDYGNIWSMAINCNKFEILNNLLLWQYPTEYCLNFIQYRVADHRSAKYSNRVARKWVDNNLKSYQSLHILRNFPVSKCYQLT